MKICYAAISEKGRRANNEDAYNVVEMPKKLSVDGDCV